MNSEILERTFGSFESNSSSFRKGTSLLDNNFFRKISVKYLFTRVRFQPNKRRQFFDAKSARESINLTICLPHLLLPEFKNSDVAVQLLRTEVNH